MEGPQGLQGLPPRMLSIESYRYHMLGSPGREHGM